MTVVLFLLNTGEKISEFDSDSDARIEMHKLNENLGLEKLTHTRFKDGLEMQTGTKIIAPYAITEYNIWKKYKTSITLVSFDSNEE